MKIKRLTLAQAKKLNLSRFNRDVRPEHVAKILTGMTENFDLIPPIRVSTDNIILDGTHRLRAYLTGMEQGKLPANTTIPVIFVKSTPEEEMEFIKKTNSGTKPYILSDYVKMNMEAGSDSISKLDKWCSERELCINQKHTFNRVKYAYGAAFLLGKRSDASLKNGTFELTKEDIKTGTKIYNEINELRTILGWPSNSVRYDIWAKVWRDMRDKHSFTEWKNVFETQKKAISARTPYSVKGFIDLLNAVSSMAGKETKKKVAKK